MNCPGCKAPMAEHHLDGHVGTTVTIDVCLGCQAFWFDGHESLRLTPGATLRLFRIIGEQAARHPLPATSSCPRCGTSLVLTHDMQRTTRFQYRRCPRRHGRFITFFDFLRQKDFIRPMSADQLADLRAHVAIVNCSNCGAPIDLAATSSCTHCGSPLSMLDVGQAERLLSTLRAADRASVPVTPDATLAFDLARSRRDVEAAFAAFERSPSWYNEAATAGTVGAGLKALGRWLKQQL